MNADGSTLIIISCSARKRRAAGRRLPAIDLYDGVLFKVIRKALREGRVPTGLDVGIVSARFGLVGMRFRLPYYDQRLNRKRAVVLRPAVQRSLRRTLQRGRYGRVFINLGRDYALMIEDMPELKDAVWASGSIGRRAATLKSWLVEDRRR